MSYEINILSNAERTLRKLPRPLQIRISAEIMKLADDPRGYRIRIGDYRVLYSIDDGIKIIAVFKIAHRKDAYR
jgi:mRNA interferase RelE/StbE